MRISPILLLLVAVLGCGSGTEPTKPSAELPAEASSAEIPFDQKIFELKTFDFRPKPLKYAPNDPKAKAAIEAEIRRLAGKSTGEPTQADLEMVTSVNLSTKNITDLAPLAKLTNLESLSISKNGVTRLTPLSGMTKLEHLFLPFQSITDLTPLAGLTKLEKLYLSSNYVADVTPLAGLTKLNVLWLNENYITDVTPLAGLTKLKELHLKDNKITNLKPLVGLTNLKSLLIHNNHNLNKGEVDKLQKALPNCKISHNATK